MTWYFSVQVDSAKKRVVQLKRYDYQLLYRTGNKITPITYLYMIIIFYSSLQYLV